jgi:hypothetical protein
MIGSGHAEESGTPTCPQPVHRQRTRAKNVFATADKVKIAMKRE